MRRGQCFILFLFYRNVVKAFYTSGMLFDVLTTFGELSEEIQQNRKYAKWKAAYIHNCLKNGETPVPGPMKGDDDEEEEGGNDLIGGSGISGGNEKPSSDLPTVPSPSSPGSSNAVDDFGNYFMGPGCLFQLKFYSTIVKCFSFPPSCIFNYRTSTCSSKSTSQST